MKIGLFTTDFPPKKPFKDVVPKNGSLVLGGVGEDSYQLTLALAERGHEITIFTTSATAGRDEETWGPVRLVRYGKTMKIADTDVSLQYLRGPREYDSFDIVHLQAGSPPATLAALSYLRAKSVPLIVTHHLDPECSGSVIKRAMIGIYGRWFLERALERSSAIIALSQEFSAASPYLSRYTDKLRIIPNGITVKHFEIEQSKQECRNRLGIPENARVILFFGNLIERKGVHILAHALPSILREHPDTFLVLAGSFATYGDRLRELCSELGITDHVLMPGTISEGRKVQYYHAADLFCLPSFAEAYPLTILEASACRLPLVVSDIPVFKAVVTDGENGLFTRTGDSDDLAGKILQILGDERLRDRMGEAARRRVLDFSWEKVADQTERLYREYA
jgi:glycosyltransferase involved in cell wall biosynthesis